MAAKSDKKNVLVGVVSITASFNNIIVTIADTQGNVISWASAGSVGFKGAKKSTPYAGQVAATRAAEQAKKYGLKTVSAVLKGPGPIRESALRAIQASGLMVISIRDDTPVPHNGCRPRKRRRV